VLVSIELRDPLIVSFKSSFHAAHAETEIKVNVLSACSALIDASFEKKAICGLLPGIKEVTNPLFE